MSRQTLSNILFWFLAGVSAVLLVAMVLVVAGIVPIDSAADAPLTSTEAIEPATTAPPVKARSTERTTTPAVSPRAAVEPTVVVVTAARGDSWFSARVGSENGRVLDERVLAQGESVRLRGERIWLTVGAAGNVDVTVGGKPRALSPGTVSVVLTPSRTTATNS